MRKNKFRKYPFTCIDTGETVNSYEEYLTTKHWKEVKEKYLSSKLSKICQHCGKSNIPYDFHHRTYKRIGREYLLDIIPLCKDCHFSSNERLKLPHNSKTRLWDIHKKGRKKVVRLQLNGFSFKPSLLSEKEYWDFINIKPNLRGCVLSKYFANKVKGHHVGSKWINDQISSASKWIKKEISKNLIFSE